MEIRSLEERDLAGLARLYRQFWGTESNLEKMQTAFQRLSQNPSTMILVAEENGCVAGSVMGIACEELYGECMPFLVVEDVIVDQEYRRMGIGTRLMQELERWAVGKGCQYVILVTEQNRVDAHRFYESLGYPAGCHKGFKKRLGG